jgi:hypothetical protein
MIIINLSHNFAEPNLIQFEIWNDKGLTDHYLIKKEYKKQEIERLRKIYMSKGQSVVCQIDNY